MKKYDFYQTKLHAEWDNTDSSWGVFSTDVCFGRVKTGIYYTGFRTKENAEKTIPGEIRREIKVLKKFERDGRSVRWLDEDGVVRV